MGKRLINSQDIERSFSNNCNSRCGLYWFRVCSYLKYLIKAKGIIMMHSPFVYDLQRHLLYKKPGKCESIYKLRQELLNSKLRIKKEDFGAGGIKYGYIYEIYVAREAARSSTSLKASSLIAELTHYFKAKRIVELGTSFGLTTATIALRNTTSEVVTIDGSREILDIAISNFERLGITNVKTICSDFDTALEENIIFDSFTPSNPELHIDILCNHSDEEMIDMVLFDGNHQKNATLRYFNYFLKHKHSETVFIFDDIYWSKEMSEAWQQIKQHKDVTLTIDIYEMGLVFFSRNIKEKRDFVVRY